MQVYSRTLSSDTEAITRLQRAFPDSLAQEVKCVAALLPHPFLNTSIHNIGIVVVAGESIRIPYRIYIPEPEENVVSVLAPIQKTILACIYTRHNDGYIRQKYLEKILLQHEPWVMPYIFQLMSEYVLEILELISQNLDQLDKQACTSFIKENPVFVQRLKKRVISYWNCYYRYSYPHFGEYIGFHLLDFLGLW